MRASRFILPVGFLLGLHVACARPPAPPASAPIIQGKTDAATLLPQLKSEYIADQWQNARYGIIVNRNGSLSLVYLANGEPIATTTTWYLQGESRDAAGKATHKHLDTPAHIEAPIDILADAEGNRVYEIKDVRNSYLSWSSRIICKPDTLRVELQVTPSQPVPAGVSPNLFTSVRVVAFTTAPFNQPNDNPIVLITPRGQAEISFPHDFRWFKGYWLDGKTFNFSPLNQQPWEVGKTYSFFTEFKL